ncbi:MAG: TlpA family protein disulfide reductase [Bacteroidales bacterium]|nr:TlpA family protein disulfide reductase [Bacteroidales bacterium]
MKKTIILISINLMFFGAILSQENFNKLPSVDVKTLSGKTLNTSKISNDGPIFLSFWATWCKPCIRELIAIDENYIDWQEETGLKVYAVSIDDTKSTGRVAPFVNGRAWEFEVLLDANSDFKRAMNVINVPHSFILNKNGEVVWQHTSYSPGDEDEIYEVIKKVAAGEDINH